MRVIITGSKGTGKSTLCQRIIDQLQWKASGFITGPICRDKKRIGFDLFALESGLMLTPGFPIVRENYLGEFKVYTQAFDELGIRAIQRALKQGTDCILMDEVGRFERNNTAFLDLVFQAITQKQIPVLVVLKKEDLPFNEKVWALEEGLHIDLDAVSREKAFDKAIRYFKEKMEG